MFHPKLDVLPAAQRALWPKLVQVPEHFVLYGGTAVALRLGHRTSIDFDFFTAESFAPADLVGAIPLLQEPGARVQQSQPNTFTVEILTAAGAAKLSFFGMIDFGQIRPPDRCHANGLKVASAEDLLALKLATIHSRIEAKDYVDIHALLGSGLSLPEALSHLEALHPQTINWMITLHTLVYFQGGDLAQLPEQTKRDLEEAVRGVRVVSKFTGTKRPVGWMP
jgi:hypothetical protein